MGFMQSEMPETQIMKSVGDRILLGSSEAYWVF